MIQSRRHLRYTYVVYLLALAAGGAACTPLGDSALPLPQRNTQELTQTGVDAARADLSVRAVNNPPSALPFDFFTVDVQLCNEGTRAGDNIDVQLELAPAGAGGVGGMPIGGQRISTIGADQCIEQSLLVSAPVFDGLYTILVTVDPFHRIDELAEDNNSARSAEMAIGFGPDLVVTDVYSAPSARPQQAFDIALTTCNHGTQTGGGIAVQLVFVGDAYLSDAYLSDAYLDDYYEGDTYLGDNHKGRNRGRDIARDTPPAGPADVVFGTQHIGLLNPGQCQTETIRGLAPRAQGVYTASARVDIEDALFELREDNNQTTGARIGVGYRADLIISDIVVDTASDTALDSDANTGNDGGSVAVAIKVCNQGQWPSVGPIDVEVVLTRAVEREGSKTAPDQRRNSRTHPLAGPDIDKTSIISAIAPLSLDITLGVDRCVGGTIYVASPDEAGLYVVSAVVDPPGNPSSDTEETDVGPYGIHAELIEDNNSAHGPTIAIGPGPDLQVTFVSGPSTVAPDEPFDVITTVCNRGHRASGPVDVSAVLSADDAVDHRDPAVGFASLTNLDPHTCATIAIRAFAADHGGNSAPRIGVIVDGVHVIDEAAKDNNQRTGGPVYVGRGPDWVVDDIAAPGSVARGARGDLVATVCNRGSAPSARADVHFVRSADPSIGHDDPVIAHGIAPALMPEQCADVGAEAAAIADRNGIAYIGAIVVTAIPGREITATNNASRGHRIAIGDRADIAITAIVAAEAARDFASIDPEVTVCNQGQASARATFIELRLSPTSMPFKDVDGSLIGFAFARTIAPGQCRTERGRIFARRHHALNKNDNDDDGDDDGDQNLAGSYTLTAIASPFGRRLGRRSGRLGDTQPQRATTRVAVGDSADLVIAAITPLPPPEGSQTGIAASATVDSTVAATMTVCNRGFAPSASTEVELYTAVTETIDAGANFIGAAEVATLAPGACSDITIAGSADLPARAYVLGAVIDADNHVREIDDGNNTLVGPPIDIDAHHGKADDNGSDGSGSAL